MLKKSFYLLIVLCIGAIFVFDSCNDSPITQEESPTLVGLLSGTENFFHLSGAGNPIKCTDGTRLQLWAGKPPSSQLAGYVEFSNVVGNTMTVTYVTTGSWYLTAIHFDIETTLEAIPQNHGGNPVPGQFKYNITIPPGPPVTSQSFNVVLPAGVNNAYFVAAHAGVCKSGGLNSVPSILPPGGYMCVNDKDDGCGYWKFTLTGSGWLNGQYCGWCIDAHHNGVPPGECDSVEFFSSYGPYNLGACDVNYPENFPLVNWLLNNYHEGGSVAQYDYQGFFSIPPNMAMFHNMNSQGTVSVGDIQYAVWYLLESETGTASGSTPFNIWGLVHAAYVNGAGYRPGCGDSVAIIIHPKEPAPNVCFQPLIFMVPVPCGTGGCETAWGDGKLGKTFPRAHQWGTYFRWANSYCP